MDCNYYISLIVSFLYLATILICSFSFYYPDSLIFSFSNPNACTFSLNLSLSFYNFSSSTLNISTYLPNLTTSAYSFSSLPLPSLPSLTILLCSSYSFLLSSSLFSIISALDYFITYSLFSYSSSYCLALVSYSVSY